MGISAGRKGSMRFEQDECRTISCRCRAKNSLIHDVRMRNMKKGITLCFTALLVSTTIAMAMHILWGVNGTTEPPPISMAEGYQMAVNAMSLKTNEFYCAGAHLEGDQWIYSFYSTVTNGQRWHMDVRFNPQIISGRKITRRKGDNRVIRRPWASTYSR
jgi:hypothetical protein